MNTNDPLAESEARSQPAGTPIPPGGTVYLLHFSQPYKHTRHYTGWASDLKARLAELEQGQGARLLQVIKAAGISWTLARTWPGDRKRERELKSMGGVSRRCRNAESTRRQTINGTPGTAGQSPRPVGG
jgi:predicted GIY-YIG superfamily endonuclease